MPYEKGMSARYALLGAVGLVVVSLIAVRIAVTRERSTGASAIPAPVVRESGQAAPATSPPTGNKAQGRTQTRELTPGWLVYRNSEHGYEVRYPKGATLRMRDPTLVFIDLGAEAASLSISVQRNENHLTPKEWAEELKRKALLEEEVPIPLQQVVPEIGAQEGPITLGSVSGYRLRVFAFDHNEDLVFLTREDLLYEISIPAEDPNDPQFGEHRKVFSQILATFRFVH